MSVPVITFFNNKGGVGKTSLVYHVAWMFSDLGLRVVAADLDPQANLTAAFLDEYRLEELWPDDDHPQTILGCIQPLLQGTGDVGDPHREDITDKLTLVIGDLGLSGFEDELSSQWPDCLDRKPRAFRVISAFWRVIQRAASAHEADLVLIDLGPNLGAINRAALISSSDVVVPLSPDLFSLQGLRNLGPTFRRWREERRQRLEKAPNLALDLPRGEMNPIGYVVLQHSVRLDRPVKSYEKWASAAFR
jgi:chromosome partitioning protein